jgi:hypothetical protein
MDDFLEYYMLRQYEGLTAQTAIKNFAFLMTADSDL